MNLKTMLVSELLTRALKHMSKSGHDTYLFAIKDRAGMTTTFTLKVEDRQDVPAKKEMH